MADKIETLRHSASHVLAHAVKELWPETKLGIGPSIDWGFYYDFDRKAPFVAEDLKKIEKKMKEIIAGDFKFEKEELPKAEAIKLFQKLKQPYKIELIKEIKEPTVSIYKNGSFVDLCKGPHVASTKNVKVFKLLNIAGAYWRGSENNPMLQRIYGTAWMRKEELDKFLRSREEAKKRDHRKLGRTQDLFSMHEEIGPGLVLYHPKGAMLRSLIEDFIKAEHLKRGYQLVRGPHILKSDIWVRSGHYEYYKESMYIFKIEGKEYAIKPMNCPGHMLVYKSRIRSYKDLPLKLFELGDVYRHEKSGVLHGLLRVRGFTQDDAHIFALPEQLEDEIISVIEFVNDVLKIFGFKEFEFELSTRPTKYIGREADWQAAEKALVNSLKKKKIDFRINEGEGAFYGPKIDIKLKDALGRSWQCATIQCDFALSQRFDLTYADKDGKEKRPVMLHRVILGSIERFIGALIEHYAGEFPLWLSPTQICIIPISDEQHSYAKKIQEELTAGKFRTEIDLRPITMQKKIAFAELEKIPYMVIVGKKEASRKLVSVRSKPQGNMGEMKIGGFIELLEKQLSKRR